MDNTEKPLSLQAQAEKAWRETSYEVPDSYIHGYIHGASQQTEQLQAELERYRTLYKQSDVRNTQLSIEKEALQKEVERLTDLVYQALGCADHIHYMTIQEIKKELNGK